MYQANHLAFSSSNTWLNFKVLESIESTTMKWFLTLNLSVLSFYSHAHLDYYFNLNVDKWNDISFLWHIFILNWIFVNLMWIEIERFIYFIYIYIIKNSYYCNISLRNERKYIRRKWRSVKFISGLTNVRKDNRLNAFNNLYILVRCHWRAKTKYQQHFFVNLRSCVIPQMYC